MKEYNPSGEEVKQKANPTTKTQEKVLATIEGSTNPMSITDIANKSGTSLYATKRSVNFFEKLGFLKVIKSNGGTTLVISIKKTGDSNAENKNNTL